MEYGEETTEVTCETREGVPLDLKDRALAAAAEGITISDPSLPDNPLIYVNSGFERITGYSAAAVLGKNCRFLQGPDTDPEAAAIIQRAVIEETECTVEILNYRRDGSSFWNRLSITPVRNRHGHVTHFIGVQSDVTARRDAEEALRLANARMRNNLLAAAKVQQAMLPRTGPEAPGWEFAWRYQPCDELAGDTLNCFRLDETRIGLYIIDVSGHGAAAALLSAALSRTLLPLPGQSVLYTPSPTEPSRRTITPPQIVAERLNQQFPFDDRTGQFFTMVYGVLNTETATFNYVSAGHPPLLLLDETGDVREIRRDQFPVGLVSEPHFVSDTIELKAGERLLLYTDGATDAYDEQGRQYETEGLQQAFATGRYETLEAALDGIIESLKQFGGGTTTKDDISLLALGLAEHRA